jgi:chromosome segregation ATPase
MKKLAGLLAALTFIFFSSTIWLFVVNLGLRGEKKPKSVQVAKKSEASASDEAGGKSIRQQIKSDLEEKYRADRVSYQAQIQSLRLDKERLRESLNEIEEIRSEEKTGLESETGQLKEKLTKLKKELEEVKNQLQEVNMRLEITQARLEECKKGRSQ